MALRQNTERRRLSLPLRNVWHCASKYVRDFGGQHFDQPDKMFLQLAPGDDLIMSNMYSLLNYIAATSKDMYDINKPNVHGYGIGIGQNNPYSLETGLRGLSEDEKRSVGISTISAVTRLALEFDMEEVSFRLRFFVERRFKRSP